MQSSTDHLAFERARSLADAPMDEAVVARLELRGTSAQARRLATCEQASPARAAAWRRLAVLMGSLAPARHRFLARAMMFYIADGRFVQQVFSLEDSPDGSIVACCEDVLELAIAAGMLAQQSGQPHRHCVFGTPQAIHIERMDGKTENMPPHCTAMTGWNRLALRIVLPARPAAEQLESAAILCALTSSRWRAAQT